MGLGGRLGWHGALSMGYIVDRTGQPWYIDSNPRLAEPGNALVSGINLPDLLVRVSLGEQGEAPGLWAETWPRVLSTG